eukprot:CAMPEP_0202922436 /NCGR_PEP_ID=MMETSP1392-20130828/77920_1 /ASSEMBLY_ACC=CAM_ASM_000868 /TAXON_ID=225041 /ORGANISM="Chlamydomonas chlamydogama, Strain SAG 11-48b" /LENGTH=37 /DNA_ID= /DNA_START= /DNA_END= /DNA_ORIENTATION=
MQDQGLQGGAVRQPAEDVVVEDGAREVQVAGGLSRLR